MAQHLRRTHNEYFAVSQPATNLTARQETVQRAFTVHVAKVFLTLLMHRTLTRQQADICGHWCTAAKRSLPSKSRVTPQQHDPYSAAIHTLVSTSSGTTRKGVSCSALPVTLLQTVTNIANTLSCHMPTYSSIEAANSSRIRPNVLFFFFQVLASSRYTRS